MGTNDPPSQRDPAKDYEAGIKVYLSHLNDLLSAEQGARDTYDPQRLQEGLDNTGTYGPKMDAIELARLNALDPQSQAIRAQMAGLVSKDLANGYALPDDLKTQTENDIRGAQTARGNYLGNGAVTAEAAYKGKTAVDMYNRRLANAGTFLSQPTPTQQISQLQPVTPDRSAQYTVGGFNAGPQGVAFGQTAYNQALAGYNATPNPWATALGGAASGAAAGSAAGPYGTAIGAVVGGVGGYFASDARLKENIEDTGARHRGARIVDFNYKGSAERLRGVIADEVEQVMPWLVRVINGIKHVNYGELGLQMRRVG